MPATLDLIIALAAAFQPVPPPVAQTNADCTVPTYASDQLICGDPGLWALDAQLAQRLREQPGRAVGRWIEDQDSWFKRSRLCAFQADHAGCLRAAYAERLAVLSAAADELAGEEAGLCPDRSLRMIRADRLPVGAAALVAKDGSLEGVAILSSKTGWRPFLTSASSGRNTLFRDLDGKTVARCKATGKR